MLQLYNGGGYRTQEQYNELKKDIKDNGIKKPIQIVRNKDGKIEIENGNHRLLIAKELGYKTVPVEMVENWNDFTSSYKSVNNIIGEEYYENTENNKTINSSNERKWDIDGNSGNNSQQFKNRTATNRDDGIYQEIQQYNNGPSSVSTFKEYVKKVNIPRNEEATKKENVKQFGNNIQVQYDSVNID